MKDPRTEYESILADFAIPGRRWQNLFRLTYWGKAAGLIADDIIDDAHGVCVTDRDADIRWSWDRASPKDYRPQSNWRYRSPRMTKPKSPPLCPHYVRNLIGDIQAAQNTTVEAVRDLSPFSIPTDGRAQTVAFLHLIFDPNWLLYAFHPKPKPPTPTDYPPTETGINGHNFMSCRDWVARIKSGGTIPGQVIVPNPFTGEAQETTNGKGEKVKSCVLQSCLARFPFIVVEFDAMSLPLQFAFWHGMLSRSPLSPSVAAITYSGGKSLHGLLHAGCDTLAEWQTVKSKLCRLLATDTEQHTDPNGKIVSPYRADEQAMCPRQGTRLPGVRRLSNGNLQSLLYLNPEAVRAAQK